MCDVMILGRFFVGKVVGAFKADPTVKNIYIRGLTVAVSHGSDSDSERASTPLNSPDCDWIAWAVTRYCRVADSSAVIPC